MVRTGLRRYGYRLRKAGMIGAWSSLGLSLRVSPEWSSLHSRVYLGRLDFADPPPKADRASQVALAEPQKLRLTEGVIPTAGAPKTLIEWAVLILNTSDPALKVGIMLSVGPAQLINRADRLNALDMRSTSFALENWHRSVIARQTRPVRPIRPHAKRSTSKTPSTSDK